MRVFEGGSRVVSREQVVNSLIMFSVVYSILFILFIFLLNRKIQHGPIEEVKEGIHFKNPYGKGV